MQINKAKIKNNLQFDSIHLNNKLLIFYLCFMLYANKSTAVKFAVKQSSWYSLWAMGFSSTGNCVTVGK